MDSETNAFQDIPPTQLGHFRLYFYAAVYHVINAVRRLNELQGSSLEQTLKDYPFLQLYLAQMRPYLPEDVSWNDPFLQRYLSQVRTDSPKDVSWNDALTWWQENLEAWEDANWLDAADDNLPLLALAELEGLDYDSRIALMLVGLVEEDSRFGTLLAQLQAPLDYRRPSLELVGQMMKAKESPNGFDAGLVCRPLLDNGLIEIANPDAPRSEWLLRVPSMLWDAIRGDVVSRPTPWCRVHMSAEYLPVSELIFPELFLDQLRQVPALAESGKVEAIVLRGSPGSDRLRVAGALARDLGQHVAAVNGSNDLTPEQWRRLGPYCTLACALPVLTYDLGPGETATLPELTGYQGPIMVLMGQEGGLRGKAAEKALTLTLPLLRQADRELCWQAAFGDHPVIGLTEISERFHLPGGYIRQAASMAMTHAALNQHEVVCIDDVLVACRTLNRQMLDTLAARLDVFGTWDQLVTSEMMAAKLWELEQRCCHRERLLDQLSQAFGNCRNRGVRALFTGVSGTGKTLAARILAAELGMDLYRVDLAAIVNKYIGETEKNLHQVLSRAEELDVILLLDEGDALLGSRTEVKSANDRYANLETNYLLQRLENYEGIVIVTTNAGENIDKAFKRRMDIVVQFVSPQTQERWQIWQLHLPANHRAGRRFLEEVAIRCTMTGGQIRNAALHATLLAMEDGGVIRRRHLEEAVRSEYRKAGAVCPLNNGRVHVSDQQEDVEAFLNLLSY